MGNTWKAPCLKCPLASGTVQKAGYMSDNRALYIEETITGAVKRLLVGRVNEILADAEFPVPSIEFGGYPGGSALAGASALVFSTCERTEKERIIRLNAYTVTIFFILPENYYRYIKNHPVQGTLSWDRQRRLQRLFLMWRSRSLAVSFHLCSRLTGDIYNTTTTNHRHNHGENPQSATIQNSKMI
jgi:hypothetical protein